MIRWYRWILRIYPTAIRRRHGDEMLDVVRRRWNALHEAPALRRTLFLLRTGGDAILHGIVARSEEGSGAVAAGARAFLREIRAAVRSLRRAPGFTALAVGTLAVGIGANTAIFSVVETVLLEPLPYPGADRLAVLAPRPWTPSEIAIELERTAGSVEGMAGVYPRDYTVTGGPEPVQVQGAGMTPDFFRVLGRGVALGRSFTDEETRPGAAPTVILGDGLWRERFGGAPDVLGRTIRVNGAPREIIGVAEPGVGRAIPGWEEIRLWLPLELAPTGPDGSARWVMPLLRLREGATPAAAGRELAAVLDRFTRRHPEAGPLQARRNARVETVKRALTGDVRPALLLLQLAVGIVLLLACVNVANLLLVRASAREGELAVRSALGASRARVAGHLLAESVVLSLAGGVAALVMVVPVLRLVVALAPSDVPRIDAVSLDAPVLFFTLGVSLLTGLLFGFVPAAATARRRVSDVLKGDTRTAAGSRRKHRMSQALVAAQVTLTLVLLVGAGLLVRSFANLTGQDPGFRTEGVISVPLHISEDRYRSVPELEAFYREARVRVAGLPGVEAVGVSNHLPIRQGSATRSVEIEGREDPEIAQYGVASPGYFRALEIPVLRGRAFREADRRDARPVALVNEAFRRRTWPGGDAVGKRIRFEDAEEWRTVVGVIGDVRGDGLAREPRPGFYVPYVQRPATEVELAVGREAALVVRSRAEGGVLAPALRRAIWEVDPAQPVPEITPLERIVAREAGPERFRAVLVAAFAGMALLLVVAGIYGVVAYLVAERTREFGIRVALGATRGDLAATVLRWGLRVTAVGIALGLLGVLGMSRYLSSLLFGVTPADPLTLAAAVGVVVAVTLGACLVPLRRALGVDPVDALTPEA